MVDDIFTATENFFTHILGAQVKLAKTIGNDFYCSFIEIKFGKTKRSFYLYFKKDTIEYLAKIWLGCNEFDMADLLCEISNQIVGQIKMMMSERQIHCSLSTPKFVGFVKKCEKLDKTVIFKLKNRNFIIGYKDE